jgi:hypothetical protein
LAPCRGSGARRRGFRGRPQAAGQPQGLQGGHVPTVAVGEEALALARGRLALAAQVDVVAGLTALARHQHGYLEGEAPVGGDGQDEVVVDCRLAADRLGDAQHAVAVLDVAPDPVDLAVRLDEGGGTGHSRHRTDLHRRLVPGPGVLPAPPGPITVN